MKNEGVVADCQQGFIAFTKYTYPENLDLFFTKIIVFCKFGWKTLINYLSNLTKELFHWMNHQITEVTADNYCYWSSTS